MAKILYVFGKKPYLNITNKCPMACDFCIRKNGEGLGDAETLWHKGDPSLEEIKNAVKAYDFSDTDEIIFCGYGEPTEAFDNLIETAKFIKENYNVKIRINTNGLGDLINGFPTAEKLCEYIDTVSISLNAPTAEKYQALCHSKFGEKSFDAMLQYVRDCVKYGADVKVSVVDVISKEDIEACKAVAESLGVPLRVREKE